MAGIPQPRGRRDMNSNNFVVLPNNKAKSVKLNARNLKEMQMETVALENESKEMEEKLQQLKDSMSKEKAERGHSGKFRWTAGQSGPLNSYSLTASSKKSQQDKLEKLSAGKLKIRVLNDVPLIAPPQPPPKLPPKPPFPPNGLQMTKKRLNGVICGQCEAKTAGLVCAECTESYCIGCFARFHQKGALKLHKMIPIQKELQTHVNTQDVVRLFQKPINPSSCPSASTRPNLSPSTSPNPTYTTTSRRRRGNYSLENRTEVEEKHVQCHTGDTQVLVVHHEEEDKVGLMEDNEKGFSSSLLSGEYNEEESLKSFQEAVMQWRREKSNSGGGLITANKMWTPVRPVSVSAMATQADLPADRGAEGQRRGGEKERVPVKVEFTENSLTYMDRLLLKKHRRTQVEIYHPPSKSGTDLKSQPDINIEEDTTSNPIGNVHPC